MFRHFALTGIAIAVVWSGESAAWNGQGHMMVAEVAWKNLDAHTRCVVGKLVALNPSYADWVSDAAPNQQSQVGFVMAATWPDKIKMKGSGYKFDGEDASTQSASNNIGYSDTFQHRYWHFVDNAFSTDGTPTPATPAVNAMERINTFSATLQSANASDRLKSYDLVWLIHLVGDVHQPLHATSRYSSTFPKGDIGGNAVKVEQASNLHAYWDDLLGDSDDPDDAITAADNLPAAPTNAAAKASPAAWVKESFQDAQNIAYAAPVGDATGPFDLSQGDYEAKASQEAQNRVALAGIRLADLLMADLAATPCP